MSYRDLRNFSESMRSLGFPTPISLDSFREPNLELTERCVRWLAARLEPDARLAGGTDTLEERVALVTHAVSFFLSRANVRLSGRRLYGADGWAVRELAKVAALLKAATRHGDDNAPAPVNYDVTSRLGEIKQARQLATDITAQGAFLFDLLTKEPENKCLRDEALSRPLELSSLETAVTLALSSARRRALDTRSLIEGAAAAVDALAHKTERRTADLQRAEKRLHAVMKIKPAYQGELRSLETSVSLLWSQYVLRYRCVEALKHQLSVLENAQAEAAEDQQTAIMQLIHKYEAEDVLGKISDEDDSASSEEQPSAEPQRPATRPSTRLRIKTAGGGADSRRAFGSMATRDSLDDIRDEDSDDDDDPSDAPGYAGGRGSPRWSRARPSTRTLPRDDDLRHLGGELEAADSLGSSSESELRLESGRPSAARDRGSVLSDNEF